MAAPSRVENAGLGEVRAWLAAEPAAFEFFQAVRLLERLYPERARVGVFADPAAEVAHFSAHPSVAFPTSEIETLELPADGPARVVVNFMGLIGPLGVLPHHYTLLVAERLRARDRALQSFLDIFQHRIIALFYRAWEKYHFTAAYERDQRDRVTEHLLDLVGLGLEGGRRHLKVQSETLLLYAGALLPQPRSAVALQRMLEDFFAVPVDIQQFVGGWYRLDEPTQCWIGSETGASDRVGLGAVVGDEIWDQQARVRIRLGPLTRAQYERFLPTGADHAVLRALAQLFSHDQFEFDVQLVLAKDEVPHCRLGGDGERPAALGWGTWLKTVAGTRDADETLLTL